MVNGLESLHATHGHEPPRRQKARLDEGCVPRAARRGMGADAPGNRSFGGFYITALVHTH